MILYWPVGDEQRCVHEPLHTVGEAGLLSWWQAAAEAPGHTYVPARVIEMMHLRHQLGALLLDGEVGLEVIATAAGSSWEVETCSSWWCEASITQSFISSRVWPEEIVTY